MRKKSKKLTVNKETLRTLNAGEMQAVEGGARLQLGMKTLIQEPTNTIGCPTWSGCTHGMCRDFNVAQLALNPGVKF